MKQLSLTQMRAKLGKLVVEVEKGKRPIAITQGSKIKAVLVSAEWYSTRIFQDAEQGKHSIVVPVVVFEETARLVEKKVVRLAVPFRRWAEELDRSANFQV